MNKAAHSAPAACHNKLLQEFPLAVRARVERNLRPVWLTSGQSLWAPGLSLQHAYFPTSAIVSLQTVTADGHGTTNAIVGSDGLVGLTLLVGGESTASSAIVASEGWAFRLGAESLKEEIDSNGDLMRLLLRYTRALMTQMGQMAVCSRHHSLDQQLYRWLLQCLDRAASTNLNMTQEFIGLMLGARREGVTVAAGKLQNLGVIRYCRGHITVIDRPRLESLCCECYGVISREHNRLLERRLQEAHDVVARPAVARRQPQAEPRIEELWPTPPWSTPSARVELLCRDQLRSRTDEIAFAQSRIRVSSITHRHPQRMSR